MRNLIAACGGRRFVLCLGCGVVCTVLVWATKIDGTIFRDIILGTVAAYITGNTVQKVKAPNVSDSGSVRHDE